METLIRPFLEWHTASVPYADNSETGDIGFVRSNGERALAVAVDALGHGADAAHVAAAAEAHLRAAADSPLEGMMRDCHEALRATRGAAVCLAQLDAASNTLSWLSVGNIQGVHVSIDRNGLPEYESLIMRGGVVGDRLPELRTSRASLKPGDMLVLATDGIGFGWYGEYRAGISPVELADSLMRKHCHGNDDAMVLVVRYDGSEAGTGTR